MKSFLLKINQEFTKSLPSQRNVSEKADTEDESEDLDELLLDEKQEASSESVSQEPAPAATTIKVPKQEKPTVTVVKKKPQVVRIEKVETKHVEAEPTKEFISNDPLYTEEEQLDDDGNIFGEEIYDIMEIDQEIEQEGTENIYLDETGKQVLGDDDSEFILVNFKSSNEDLTDRDTQFELEQVYEDDSSQSKKVNRKKHVNRMPREIVEKYAQTTDDNQHICTKCVKVFSTRTNLIRHIQSHDGYKAYVCQLCSKGFTQSGSLKQHMYIHTGERPFKCNYCTREFTQAKTLKFHLRRHTEEKPFSCSECSTAFRQRDGLKRHLKAKHNIELKYDRNTHEKLIAIVDIENADVSETKQDLSVEVSGGVCVKKE